MVISRLNQIIIFKSRMFANVCELNVRRTFVVKMLPDTLSANVRRTFVMSMSADAFSANVRRTFVTSMSAERSILSLRTRVVEGDGSANVRFFGDSGMVSQTCRVNCEFPNINIYNI